MGVDVEYDLQALRDGLVKCDGNIRIFEQAIEGEQDTKKKFRHMISVLEEKLERTNRLHNRPDQFSTGD